jgi:hypothetical protein
MKTTVLPTAATLSTSTYIKHYQLSKAVLGNLEKLATPL